MWRKAKYIVYKSCGEIEVQTDAMVTERRAVYKAVISSSKCAKISQNGKVSRFQFFKTVTEILKQAGKTEGFWTGIHPIGDLRIKNSLN